MRNVLLSGNIKMQDQNGGPKIQHLVKEGPVTSVRYGPAKLHQSGMQAGCEFNTFSIYEHC